MSNEEEKPHAAGLRHRHSCYALRFLGERRMCALVYNQCGTSCWQTSETRDTSRCRPRTIVPCLPHSHTSRSCVSLNPPQSKKTRVERVEKLPWRGFGFCRQTEREFKTELKFSHKNNRGSYIYCAHLILWPMKVTLLMKSYHKYCLVTCLTIHKYVKFLQTIHKDPPFSFNSCIIFLSKVGCNLFLHSTINGYLGNFSLFPL